MGDLFVLQELCFWFFFQEDFLDVWELYEGVDIWFGGFKKDEVYNGLDVNVFNNILLWVFIDFDNQYYFNFLAWGDNNNCWKGICNWKNGE